MEEQALGPIEALKLALEKEKEAQALYRRLSLTSKVAAEVFGFLINEEQKHQLLIEEKIRELTK